MTRNMNASFKLVDHRAILVATMLLMASLNGPAQSQPVAGAQTSRAIAAIPPPTVILLPAKSTDSRTRGIDSVVPAPRSSLPQGKLKPRKSSVRLSFGADEELLRQSEWKPPGLVLLTLRF